MSAPTTIMLVLGPTGWRWSLWEEEPDTPQHMAIAVSRDDDDGFDAEQAISQALAVKASYEKKGSAFQ